jgi:hypothetical protein
LLAYFADHYQNAIYRIDPYRVQGMKLLQPFGLLDQRPGKTRSLKRFGLAVVDVGPFRPRSRIC